MTTHDPSEHQAASRSRGRRHADRALREVEAKAGASYAESAANEGLSHLLAALPIVVYTCKTEGDFGVTFVSENVRNVTGYAPEDFLAQSSFWAERIHPDDAPRVFADLPRVLEKGTHEREYRWRVADGSHKWFADSLRLVRTSAGAPDHLVGVWEDITERKQVQEALRESEEKLRAIMDQTKDLIAVTDANGFITFASSASHSLLQYAPEEMCGRHFKEFLEDWVVPTAVAEFQKGRTRGQLAQNLELTMKRKDGSTFIGELNSSDLVVGERKHALVIIRDITERRRAEAELRQANERLSLAAAAGGVGIWDLNVVGNKLTWDEQMFRLHGMEPDSFGGAYETWKARVHPQDLERADTEVQMALRGEKEFDTEFRVVWPDGAVHHIRARARVRRNPAGQPVELIGTNYDITELKRAEESLRRTQFVVDHSPNHHHWVDSEGRFLYVNDASCRRLGYSREELLGMTVYDIDSGVPAPWSSHLQDLRERGSLCYESVHRAKDGETYPVEVTANYVNFEGQEYSCAFVHDITERKRMEEALRLTQLSVDRAADLIEWVGPEAELLYVNDAVCARSGYSREELLGMRVWDVDPGVSPELWSSRWDNIRRQGSFYREITHRAKSGEIYPLEITSNFIKHGDKEYLFAFLRDISERKQAEETLRQTEEHLRQSQKMEAVGQLAGGIAHDFNNLLTAVLGYSNMILASGSSTVDEVRPDLEEIKRAGERASALTRQILAFSRRQTLRPQVILLDEIIAGMEPLLRRSIGEDIELVVLDSPGLAPVEVDPHQFEQVLMNLVLNARDAMPAGGRLTIKTGNVQLGQKYCDTHPEIAPGNYAMLSVSDTGVGMDPKVLEHVFEPFFTTKPPGAGTGLGLSTVYGIVRQSRGFVFAGSEPGNGSSFEIYLPPSVQLDEPKETLVPPRHSTRGSESVMVVEDEPALRGLIERILGGAGYASLAFGSASEALGVVEQGEHPIDLLLTDVVLPGAMQGHELARAVHALRPDLPVLYISGYSRDALVHAGRLAEGVNLLEKPFTPETLARMVRAVLDQPRSSR